MNQKWEYGVAKFSIDERSPAEIKRVLDDWAKNGWDLHSITSIPGDDDLFVFKREIPEPRKPAKPSDPNDDTQG